VIGQIAIVPALLALLLALTLSVIGILLIPFAVVAYALAIAGLCTLGLLAVARMAGRGMRKGPVDPTARAQRLAALQGVLLGIVLLGLPWIVAAGLSYWSQPGLIAIVLAFATTWVAISAGFGATLLTRAGTRAAVSASPTSLAAAPTGASWQTPTPVSGVVAARRPTPLSKPRP
ncbi:MAG: hypothetical protein K2X99_12160, partial [Gemmatimonadaceae bacterium]|nr:hypothetical protein [Gemmatimonadaceae bacterium]